MEKLYENNQWTVFQSDINPDVVVFWQKNNQLGALNFSVDKKQLEALWSITQMVDFKERMNYEPPKPASLPTR